MIFPQPFTYGISLDSQQFIFFEVTLSSPYISCYFYIIVFFFSIIQFSSVVSSQKSIVTVSGFLLLFKFLLFVLFLFIYCLFVCLFWGQDFKQPSRASNALDEDEEKLELWTFPPPPHCWNDRCTSLCLSVYLGGMDPAALCVLDSHSSYRTISTILVRLSISCVSTFWAWFQHFRAAFGLITFCCITRFNDSPAPLILPDSMLFHMKLKLVEFFSSVYPYGCEFIVTYLPPVSASYWDFYPSYCIMDHISWQRILKQSLFIARLW